MTTDVDELDVDAGEPRGAHAIVDRVCAYAQQVCMLADGCTIDEDLVASWDARAIELEALSCEQHGAMLSHAEATYHLMYEGRMRDGHREGLRTRRIRQLGGLQQEDG